MGDRVANVSSSLMLEGDGGAIEVYLVGVEGSDSLFWEGNIMSGFVNVGEGRPSDVIDGFFVCMAATAGWAWASIALRCAIADDVLVVGKRTSGAIFGGQAEQDSGDH